MGTAAFYYGEEQPEDLSKNPFDMSTLCDESEYGEKWVQFYAERLIQQTEQALVKACAEES